MPEAMAEVLRQHAIDPAALLPNQVHLFLNADDEQRYRLLELWRIAPPSYPLEEHLNGSNGTWITTSVEREENLAKIRWEQRQQQQHEQQRQKLSLVIDPIVQERQPPGMMEEGGLDTYIPPLATNSEPISPIREAGEPAWPPAARMRAASIAAAKSTNNSRPATRHGGEAEPYIVHGYAVDQRAKSADPVYAAAAGLWQAPSYAQAMEDQYGAFEEMRSYGGWGGRQEGFGTGQQARQQEDWDMEL